MRGWKRNGYLTHTWGGCEHGKGRLIHVATQCWICSADALHITSKRKFSTNLYSTKKSSDQKVFRISLLKKLWRSAFFWRLCWKVILSKSDSALSSFNCSSSTRCMAAAFSWWTFSCVTWALSSSTGNACAKNHVIPHGIKNNPKQSGLSWNSGKPHGQNVH